MKLNKTDLVKIGLVQLIYAQQTFIYTTDFGWIGESF